MKPLTLILSNDLALNAAVFFARTAHLPLVKAKID